MYQWNKVGAVSVCTCQHLLYRRWTFNTCQPALSCTMHVLPLALCRAAQNILPLPHPSAPLQVTTSINNLILGRIYIDHGGIMKVGGAQKGTAVAEPPATVPQLRLAAGTSSCTPPTPSPPNPFPPVSS